MHPTITAFLEGKDASIQNSTVTLSYETRNQPYNIQDQFDPITLQLNASLFDMCTTQEEAIEILEDAFWERIEADNNSFCCSNFRGKSCICQTNHIIHIQAICLGLVLLGVCTILECWRMG